MISGLIFDMDGIIFDTEKMLAHFWHEAASEFGYDMNISHSIAIRSTAPDKAAKILKDFFGEDFDYIKVRARRRELMNKYIEENGLPLKKGVIDILESAKINGMKTAIATATDIERTKWYLERENIINYFDNIVTTGMVERGKPYPDIYQFAAMSLGLKPDHCIAFEDSPNGIISAYSAGCNVIMIPDLTEPDEEIKPLLAARLDDLSVAARLIDKF